MQTVGRYRKQVIRAGKTVEVMYTYPTKFGDKLTRSRFQNPTAEAMKVYNEQLSVDKLTRVLNTNFIPEDYWMTLTYEKHNRPKSYDEAQKKLTKFIPKLKRLFDSYKIELKYVKCTAFGERGGVHHHLVIPQGVPQREISKLWKEHTHAGINARPPSFVALYSSGEYSSIAAYIIKQKQTLEECEIRRIRKWQGSQNLKKPKVESVKEVAEVKWQEPPKAWIGYYVDTDSIRAGCNPITGRPYLFYRMIKLPPSFTCYDNDGKRLTGKAAVRWYRNNNKEYLKQNWILLNEEGEIVFRDGIKQNE